MKILVIEDDYFSTELIRRVIARDLDSHFQFTYESYLESARERLKKEHFNFILLDLRLPSENFLGVMGFIEEHRATPIFVLTSENRPEILEQCQKMGAKNCLEKSLENLQIIRAEILSHGD